MRDQIANPNMFFNEQLDEFLFLYVGRIVSRRDMLPFIITSNINNQERHKTAKNKV